MGSISGFLQKAKGNLKALKAKKDKGSQPEAPVEGQHGLVVEDVTPQATNVVNAAGLDPEAFVETQRRPFINCVYQYVAAMPNLSEGEIVDLAQEFEDKFELCFLKAEIEKPETKAAMAWMTAFIKGNEDLEAQLAAFQPKWRRVMGAGN